jgi:methylaspartate mutase epsilon subunit
MKHRFKVLLGSIGDDAHSVGLNLIALGLKEAGFIVNSLGIQNNIQDFFKTEKEYHIILISSKNGHSGLYLNEHGRKIRNHISKNKKQIWYIGGHLSISEKDETVVRRYKQMGFTRVFPHFIPMASILKFINSDISSLGINPSAIENTQKSMMIDSATENISDRKWSVEKLNKHRPSVLKSWKTGLEIDWDIVPHMHSLKNKNLNHAQSTKNCFPLLQPRTGVANIDEQIEKLKDLEKIGNDVASVQLDASSRVKNYSKAEEGVKISSYKKKSFLNGFPVPIYGQKGVVDIVNSLHVPFQIRGGAPDHRLTYEIAISGGASAVEGGFLCYLFPYDKETPPSVSLEYWQYVDRLCGLYYEKHGIVINREWFGVLTANLIPPSLAIAINVIQTVLSAKQGVKSISVGYAEQGNRSQDVAAMQALKELNVKYLHQYSILDVSITTVFHQYMAAFPKDLIKAEMLIFNSAVTAQLAKADRMMMKTPVESHKIPSTEENEWGVKICKKGFLHATEIEYNEEMVKLEKVYIIKEVDSMIQAVLKLGNGDMAKGAIIAFGKGIIDIPFSPSNYNRGEVMCVRDVDGAIRYAQFGNLPFSNEIKDFHKEKIEERKTKQRKSSLYQMIEEDLQRIAMNDFNCWPLDDCDFI